LRRPHFLERRKQEQKGKPMIREDHSRKKLD
jgi:hypothetical protein